MNQDPRNTERHSRRSIDSYSSVLHTSVPLKTREQVTVAFPLPPSDTRAAEHILPFHEQATRAADASAFLGNNDGIATSRHQQPGLLVSERSHALAANDVRATRKTRKSHKSNKGDPIPFLSSRVRVSDALHRL